MIIISSKWKERILFICMEGFGIYAIFNILAMIFYPGGTSVDKVRVGYSFCGNFFSDLGMVRTYAGEPKTLSLFLFASALVLIGIVLIIFFILMSCYFTGTKLERYSSRIGSTAGVLTGIACIGIAAAPWDLYLTIHLIFVFILSFALLFVMIFYSIAILRNTWYPNLYAWVFVAYGLVLVIYMILMVLGPDIETPSGLRIMATGQKIIIYSGMLCLFIQVLGAFLYNKRSDLSKG